MSYLFSLRFYFRLMLGVIFVVTSFNSSAMQKSSTEILWLTADAQDIGNFKSLKPVNIATDTNNLLLRELSNYDVKIKIHPLPRVEQFIKATKNSCIPNRIKTPQRLKNSLFSLPLNLYPMLRLYTLSSNTQIQVMQKNQQLASLTELFLHLPKHSLGLSKGRSYGKFFDQQIAQINPHNIYQRAGDSRFLSIIDMLNKGRFDYMLEYPTEMQNGMAAADNPPELTSIHITNSPRYILGYLACSKSEIGQQFIEDANKALRRLYQSKQFYQAHRRYLNDVDIAQFDLDYKAVFAPER